MIDPTPDNSNRLAYALGRVFHPAVVAVPTLALVLSDLPLLEAVLWTVLIAAIVILPGLVVVIVLQRRERFVHQRSTRRPLYVTAWLNVLASFLVIQLLNGPEVLRICTVTLLVWLPVQLLVNTYYTKISTHVAVAAGCTTGLWMLGKLDSPLLQIAALGIVAATAWARVTTRNHTAEQVVLGLLVGVGSVLLVFPLLLG